MSAASSDDDLDLVPFSAEAEVQEDHVAEEKCGVVEENVMEEEPLDADLASIMMETDLAGTADHALDAEAAASALHAAVPLETLQAVTDDLETTSTDEQINCECTCYPLLTRLDKAKLSAANKAALMRIGFVDDEGRVLLMRNKHVRYLSRGLNHLSAGFVCLDASRPWLVYWVLHAMALLGHRPTAQFPHITDFLSRCHHTSIGGFGGGPQQLPHLAPTYSGVLALITVGTEEAYRVPSRPLMYRWMLSLKHASGGFHLHDDGEVDIRGSYLCLSVARLLNILTPELAAGAAEYCMKCQTYEGGFGGEPGNEAHGGYAFNCMAAMAILGRLHDLNLSKAMAWLCGRQMRFEGGFQGRVNKLVDGCYSFWQGALPALIATAEAPSAAPSAAAAAKTRQQRAAVLAEAAAASVLPYDVHALQRYILLCCQQESGGLRDKPEKQRDYYHTCYTLSGLSVAQHFTAALAAAAAGSRSAPPTVVGDPANLLERTDAIYNVRADLLHKARAWYQRQPLTTHAELLAAAAAESPTPSLGGA